MEKNIHKIVSNNLIMLRKHNKLTQAGLASKFNFSDKTISKWESGESLPSIDVLVKIADFYGVTLNDLVSSDFEITEDGKRKLSKDNINKIFISLLGVSIVWLIASIIFVYTKLYTDNSPWVVFVWAVPTSLLLLLIFFRYWKVKKYMVFLVSCFVWTFLISFFMQFLALKMWVIFVLGVPTQVVVVLWSGLKNNQEKPNKLK